MLAAARPRRSLGGSAPLSTDWSSPTHTHASLPLAPAALPLLQLQAALEHLLDSYAVDVMLAGHHHSYQRTCPVLGGECQAGRARGTVHVCVGNAGAAFYDNGADPRPAWVEFEAQTTHGYARLAVGAGRFAIEAVDSRTGRVVDSAVLTPRRRGPHMMAAQQQASSAAAAAATA